MLNAIREKNPKNELELHQKKQSGELYAWKENYKKNNLEEYYHVSKTKSNSDIFDYICKNQSIDIGENERFVYFLDYMYLLDEVKGYQFGNITPDYITFIHSGLDGMRINGESRYVKEYNKTIDSIEILIDRIIDEINKSNTVNKNRKMEYFERMKSNGASHFEEAVQRVLFVNQIIWQTDHRLIGIGGLDKFLKDFYEDDKRNGHITQDDAENILKDFVKTLHMYYWFKSNMLMGDTGQIIVLGGSNAQGDYIYNDLTLMMIKVIKELALPDPKILVRVNKNIPDKVLEVAVDCMSSGLGSPLLSNDDVIIPRLIEFGVSNEDALRYTVAACWEPLVGGASVSLNNMTTFNFMRPMENMFKRDRLSTIKSFEELLDRYEFYLEKNLRAVKRVIDGAIFQYDTVMSLFIEGCQTEDASRGGAKYFNAGITTVALGNVIDSLLNIKKYVFEEKRYSLFDVKKMIILDFDGNETTYAELKAANKRYAIDDDDVIELTKKIINMVSKYTVDYRTPYGGKLKFGLSAPTYIDASIGSNASFDGRKSGEPYVVHISNDTAESYTQVINFSAVLDYRDNRFNGNVVDLMTSPSFLKDNKEKFKLLLLGGIKKGFFQLQINVIGSDILMDAIEHPEKHQGLIVRVWGFSAYFVDLPDSYKKVLLERALKNEGKYVA